MRFIRTDGDFSLSYSLKSSMYNQSLGGTRNSCWYNTICQLYNQFVILGYLDIWNDSDPEVIK